MEQEQAGCQGDFLEYAVTWPELSDDPELFIAVLGYLMTPNLVPERGWGTAHIGVKTRSDLYWLDEAWKKVAPRAEHVGANTSCPWRRPLCFGT